MPVHRRGSRWVIGGGKARYRTKRAAARAWRGYRARFNAR